MIGLHDHGWVFSSGLIGNSMDYSQRNFSKETLTLLFDRYFTRLTAFARTITRSETLAEEAVLDVFLKLWQRQNLQKIDRLDTYLFIAVRNAAVNKLRDFKRFRFEMIDDADIPLARYSAPRGNDLLIETDMMEALERAIEKLPARCKIVFRLMREERLGRVETAKVLGISVKTVDNQLAIAVRKIAEELNIDLSDPRRSKIFLCFLLSF
ncbi:sigma-70 family RNA polymerase sigma factor [Alistipes sp. An54]|uniref:sigma-70 family RNA polymerase sigma factor n=1 Tax=Alistipes sp. An54 TaxID=1965645 RepID=UPI0019D1165B|nr:sigma-70 family RNA polymerase sigma factor [Alistipes sp. An54]